VPAESERLRRRITGRDRCFLALLALLALAGTPGAVLLLQHGSHPSTDARCVTTMRASIVGGGTYTYCGAHAVAACRQFATGDEALAARCGALGLIRRR
jgi:hypothetical protein